jgi:hypothetical protein
VRAADGKRVDPLSAKRAEEQQQLARVGGARVGRALVVGQPHRQQLGRRARRITDAVALGGGRALA